MGMYTGLKLKVILDEAKLDEWGSVIKYMLDLEMSPNKTLFPFCTSHPLFSTDRWYWMLKSSSTYLEPEFLPDSKLDGNLLSVQFNIKNYCSEIQKFLDWVSPYVLKLISGQYKYEEDDTESEIILEDQKLKIKYK